MESMSTDHFQNISIICESAFPLERLISIPNDTTTPSVQKHSEPQQVLIALQQIERGGSCFIYNQITYYSTVHCNT